MVRLLVFVAVVALVVWQLKKMLAPKATEADAIWFGTWVGRVVPDGVNPKDAVETANREIAEQGGLSILLRKDRTYRLRFAGEISEGAFEVAGDGLELVPSAEKSGQDAYDFRLSFSRSLSAGGAVRMGIGKLRVVGDRLRLEPPGNVAEGAMETMEFRRA